MTHNAVDNSGRLEPSEGRQQSIFFAPPWECQVPTPGCQVPTPGCQALSSRQRARQRFLELYHQRYGYTVTRVLSGTEVLALRGVR